MDPLFSFLSILDSGLSQGLIQSVAAVSVVLSLLTLDFPDLSIEGTYPFGAALTAVLLVDFHLPPIIVLLLTFTGGCVAGSITGLLHSLLRMSKLLSGICVAAMLYSCGLLVMGGRSNIPLLDEATLLAPFEAIDTWSNTMAASSHLFFHPGTIIVLSIISILVILAAARLLVSEFGIVLRAVGMNESALRHYARNPAVYKVIGVAMANGLAALAGGVAAQHQGFADVNMGIGVLVSSLVAVILGQELFSRLRIDLSRPFRVILAAVIGALVYQVLLAAVLAAGAPPTALRFLSGAVLVLVIAVRSRRTEVMISW